MPAPSQLTEDDPRGIFGPIYTFKEWEVAKKEEKRQLEEEKARVSAEKFAKKFAGVPGGRPEHWPTDTDMDPGTWAFWLPDDWGQGIKITAATSSGSGDKPLKCWIGPPGSDAKTGYGKRFFHRKKIEEFVGYTFSMEKPERQDKEDKEKIVKSCHDLVPNWPGEADTPGEKWLPRDWSVCLRQLPTGTHRVHLPPGVKDAFLWHRACVEEWLSGNHKKLSQMEDSKKMVEIMANGKRGEDGLLNLPRAKMRRRSGEQGATATEESYARCPRLAACKMDALEGAGCPAEEGAALKQRAEVFRELLGKRGFEDVDFMAVFLLACEGEDQGAEVPEGARPYAKVVSRLLGVFYAMPPGASGEPCYQQVVEGPETAGISCSGLYLCWSPTRSAWKLSGSLDDSRAGYALFPCEEKDRDAALVPSEARVWQVLTQNFFFPPSEPAAVA